MSTRSSTTAGIPPPSNVLGYAPTHIAVLVKDNRASKLAVKLAKTLIQNPVRDRLTFIHMVSSELASYSAEQKVLAQFNQDVEMQKCISYKVLVQDEGVRLAELVAEAVSILKPHLLVIGSEGLCNDTLNEMELARRPGNKPKAPLGATHASMVPLGSTIRRKPSRMSTALRLAQHLHQQVPLLLVKTNSVGSMSTGQTAGVRCMMDLTSTSRHALEWLLGRLQPGRGDSMVLAVGKAIDPNERVRQHAVRLLTTFGVQASVSSLGGARKRLMAQPSHVGLPDAVVTDDIDILMLQAPRCRDLAPATIDLLIHARTALLIWPPDRLADGSIVKPPHPLRLMLDESVPEEERPLLRPKDQAENLVQDGPWRGRGPRYTFRERDLDDPSQPAMFPMIVPLRRSLSEALLGDGSNRFSRMERALNRSLTTHAARDRERSDVHYDNPGGGHGDSGAGDDDEVEHERHTWPLRAGPSPWQRPPRMPPINGMGSIAEEDSGQASVQTGAAPPAKGLAGARVVAGGVAARGTVIVQGAPGTRSTAASEIRGSLASQGTLPAAKGAVPSPAPAGGSGGMAASAAAAVAAIDAERAAMAQPPPLQPYQQQLLQQLEQLPPPLMSADLHSPSKRMSNGGDSITSASGSFQAGPFRRTSSTNTRLPPGTIVLGAQQPTVKPQFAAFGRTLPSVYQNGSLRRSFDRSAGGAPPHEDELQERPMSGLHSPMVHAAA